MGKSVQKKEESTQQNLPQWLGRHVKIKSWTFPHHMHTMQP